LSDTVAGYGVGRAAVYGTQGIGFCRTFAVHGIAQCVQNPPQQPLSALHSHRSTGGYHFTTWADSGDFAKRHQDDTPRAETDDLRRERFPAISGINIDQITHCAARTTR